MSIVSVTGTLDESMQGDAGLEAHQEIERGNLHNLWIKDLDPLYIMKRDWLGAVQVDYAQRGPEDEDNRYEQIAQRIPEVKKLLLDMLALAAMTPSFCGPWTLIP